MITDYELNIDYLSVQVDRIRAHAVLDGHDEAGRHEGGEVQRYRPQDLPGSGTECLCLFFLFHHGFKKLLSRGPCVLLYLFAIFPQKLRLLVYTVQAFCYHINQQISFKEKTYFMYNMS